MILAPLILALAQQAPPPSSVEAPVRPRNPFVFRCVLDKRARMLTAALDEEMWVAWDTSTGNFYKAWKGGVNFDGAVYTTVHGPQPTSKGSAYITGVEASPWTAYVDGKPVRTKVSYQGYVLAKGGVALDWYLTFGDREVTVIEVPSFCHVSDWTGFKSLPPAMFGSGTQPALCRTFVAMGLRDGEQVNVALRTDSVLLKVGEGLERQRVEQVKDEEGKVIVEHQVMELPLTARASMNWVMLAFDPIVLPAKTEEAKK